jgi:ATP-binding cassette subfamily B protein
MRRSKKIRQYDRSDCGAASLASVAAHYGADIPLAELRVKSGTDSSGCTVRGLIEAAQYFGFNAEGFRGDVASLSKIPLPAILHLRKPDGWLHFIVLYGVTKKGYKIMDPAEGNFQRVSKESLLKEWSGLLILFVRCKDSKEVVSQLRVYKRLIKLIKANSGRYITILMLSLVSIATSLAVSLFVKQLLDSIIPLANSENLFRYAIILSIVLVVTAAVSYVRGCLMVNVTVETDKRLISDYLSHLHKLPLSFFRSLKTGELVSRINDVFRIRNFITETLTGGFIALLTLIFALCVLFVMDINLAWLCTAFIPLYLSIYIIHDRVARPVARRVMESASKFQSSVIESIRSAETIKNMGLESISFNDNIGKLTILNKNIASSGRISVTASGAGEFTSGLLTVSVLIIGGAATIKGLLTPGELVSFFAITALFSAPLMQLASSISSVREGIIAADRLFDILECKTENEPIENEPTENKTVDNEVNKNKSNPYKIIESEINRSKIVVENISFGYPGRGLIINNLSFEVCSGEIVALTGRSGSGKSTIAMMLMHHISPKSGNIMFNGIDYRAFEKDIWRRIVSIVPQNPGLYGNTLLDCIICEEDRDNDRDFEYFTEIMASLELDKLAESLPCGFASHPGEGGTMLSRGQQQRIAFARAVLRKPKVLIMDEATSSLDEATEQLLCNVTLKLREKGVAVLLITHNDTTLRIADKIISI